MRHIWFVPTLRFERGNSINLLLWNPIMDVGCTFYSFIPKLWWQSIILQHTSSHLLETYIVPLSHTILLRCVGNRVLHLNNCILKINNELILDIFTTMIRFEYLESPPILVLNKSLENLEVVKNFRLVL